MLVMRIMLFLVICCGFASTKSTIHGLKKVDHMTGKKMRKLLFDQKKNSVRHQPSELPHSTEDIEYRNAVHRAYGNLPVCYGSDCDEHFPSDEVRRSLEDDHGVKYELLHRLYHYRLNEEMNQNRRSYSEAQGIVIEEVRREQSNMDDFLEGFKIGCTKLLDNYVEAQINKILGEYVQLIRTAQSCVESLYQLVTNFLSWAYEKLKSFFSPWSKDKVLQNGIDYFSQMVGVVENCGSLISDASVANFVKKVKALKKIYKGISTLAWLVYYWYWDNYKSMGEQSAYLLKHILDAVMVSTIGRRRGIEEYGNKRRGGEPPLDWICEEYYYNETDGCDCGCGAYDPDCDDPLEEVYGCYAGEGPSCSSEGVCEYETTFDVPPEWLCEFEYYNASDGCDCDCGAYDPDCDDLSQMVFGCWEDGNGYCSIDGLCEYTPVPTGWLGESWNYNSNESIDGCDCGYGIPDPDCEKDEIDYLDFGMIPYGCGNGEGVSCVDGECVYGRVIPDSWICDPENYGTGDGCHCNCGAFDPDCEEEDTITMNCECITQTCDPENFRCLGKCDSCEYFMLRLDEGGNPEEDQAAFACHLGMETFIVTVVMSLMFAVMW